MIIIYRNLQKKVKNYLKLFTLIFLLKVVLKTAFTNCLSLKFISIGFFVYVAFIYVCVYLVYKSKRRIDDKMLNDDLALFKTRKQDK